MMKVMPLITLTAFALVLGARAAPNMPAQACGRGFIQVMVVDPDGKSVPGATIEIIADAPEEYTKRVWAGGDVVLAPGQGPAVKISQREAEEIIELGVPAGKTKDICGNPLKQVAGSTGVVRFPPTPNVRESGLKNFGFCTTENYLVPSVLKVSAPGYVTDYYLGHHLGGCRREYKITLTKMDEGPERKEGG